MNIATRITAGVVIGLFAAGVVSACGSATHPDADVLEYGYYTPAHVWVVYPTPHVVHVSYSVYHADSKRYSTPSYEKTYVKDPHHTVVRTTTTTVTKTEKH